MKSFLSYINERLVLSKSKNSNIITLEEFICLVNGYNSINEWTFEEFETYPYIMSEECLTKQCHGNLYELYEYLIENLDVPVDISNPKTDNKTWFYSIKIDKYIFEATSANRL